MLAIGFEIMADHGALRQIHVTVDNSAPDAAAAPNVHMVEDDRFLHFAVTVDAHVVAEHRFFHSPARNDRAARDDGIHCCAHALWVSEYEFRGRILLLPGVERPAYVVEGEHR